MVVSLAVGHRFSLTFSVFFHRRIVVISRRLASIYRLIPMFSLAFLRFFS